jgi:uncharacterized MAPEG superfamily protein
MSFELTMLVWALALTFVQMLIAASAAALQVGVATKDDAREGVPEPKGWAGRARRAHLDMVENVVLFVPLILIADIAGRDNRMTEIGTELFIGSRVAYAIVAVIGIPRLPTIAWSASAASLVMIFLQLL